MKIAFIGCGYVFDIYMRTKWAYPEIEILGVYDIDAARASVVSTYYGLRSYENVEDLLTDPAVEVVVNLTNVRSHYDVTRMALQAGKHVYTEKPITPSVAETTHLFGLAAERGLVLTAAPCNIFSDSVSTVWKAVAEGAVGRPVLVYAEMDDNPAHLMNLESVRSPTGAPFPFQEELQEGCTFEHVGYHLVWLCAIFGPVESVTAHSTTLIETKTAAPLSPDDTPDFSVAVLTFANRVTARLTCTWVSPRDHSYTIVGDAGQLFVDNAFHDQSPVLLERFSRVSLTARKARTVRTQPLLGRRFNIGGRAIPLVRQWKSHAVGAERGVARSAKHRVVGWVRRREIHALDKLLGVAEMGRAMDEGRPQPLTPEFLTHLNELTILIQGAGPTGTTGRPETTFAALTPGAGVLDGGDYLQRYRPRLAERLLPGVLRRLQS